MNRGGVCDEHGGGDEHGVCVTNTGCDEQGVCLCDEQGCVRRTGV